MSPSPYSNVIGGLCHSLTVSLRSEQGEATERGVVMWEGCGTLDHTLRLPTTMLLQGTQVLQREGEVVNSFWWRKSSITTDFMRQKLKAEEELPHLQLPQRNQFPLLTCWKLSCNNDKVPPPPAPPRVTRVLALVHFHSAAGELMPQGRGKKTN